MTGPIENKLAWPAAAVFCSSVLASALYALLLEYDVLSPTDGQHTAILGLGAAVQYVLYVAVGYWAPHTDRPDLEEKR
jgi:hypothetical protein